MEYKDYYKILGVKREASQEEIQKSFRRLARKYHPDINKEKGAEDRFKEINEAYEVLKDAEKRAHYDALGENWQAGQNFQPPPNYEQFFSGFSKSGGGAGASFKTSFGGGSGFSSFFEALFGGGGAASFSGGVGKKTSGGSKFDSFTRQTYPKVEDEVNGELTISLKEAFSGTTKELSIQTGEEKPSRISVRIKAGAQNGSVIRLKGQGPFNPMTGEKGDLRLKINVAPDPNFKVEGNNLVTQVELAPWEVVLGTKVDVLTMTGRVKLTIPAGTQTAGRLRLRQKGLPNTSGVLGDLFVEVKVVVPTELTTEEKEIWEKLAETSKFNPRT